MTPARLTPEVTRVIDHKGFTLRPPEGIDPRRLLGAIAIVETDGGREAGPRFEPAYAPGGQYYGASGFLRHQYETYGAHACCTYGAWQIFYPTACELGYRGVPGGIREDGTPFGLWDHDIGITWVVECLRRRAFDRGALTVAAAADAYDSGNRVEDRRPSDYVVWVAQAYQALEGMEWHGGTP